MSTPGGEVAMPEADTAADLQIAIIEDRIAKVEVALVEAHTHIEPANVAICRQRLDELNDELDRLVPRQRGPAD